MEIEAGEVVSDSACSENHDANAAPATLLLLPSGMPLTDVRKGIYALRGDMTATMPCTVRGRSFLGVS